MNKASKDAGKFVTFLKRSLSFGKENKLQIYAAATTAVFFIGLFNPELALVLNGLVGMGVNGQ